MSLCIGVCGMGSSMLLVCTEADKKWWRKINWSDKFSVALWFKLFGCCSCFCCLFVCVSLFLFFFPPEAQYYWLNLFIHLNLMAHIWVLISLCPNLLSCMETLNSKFNMFEFNFYYFCITSHFFIKCLQNPEETVAEGCFYITANIKGYLPR